MEATKTTEKTVGVHRCPECGSEKVYGVSRVVGYFSRINNWNTGKKMEFDSRQKGNYAIREKN